MMRAIAVARLARVTEIIEAMPGDPDLISISIGTLGDEVLVHNATMTRLIDDGAEVKVTRRSDEYAATVEAVLGGVNVVALYGHNDTLPGPAPKSVLVAMTEEEATEWRRARAGVSA